MKHTFLFYSFPPQSTWWDQAAVGASQPATPWHAQALRAHKAKSCTSYGEATSLFPSLREQGAEDFRTLTVSIVSSIWCAHTHMNKMPLLEGSPPCPQELGQ